MAMVKQTWLLALQVGGCESSKLQKHFAELGLGDFINPVKADYSASMADVVAKYKKRKTSIVRHKDSNWTVGALKLDRTLFG